MQNERVKYRVLIVEDDDVSRKYEKAIKAACRQKIWIDPFIAQDGNTAEEYLRNCIVPFISLDQRLPDGSDEKKRKERGLRVGNVARKTQPFLSTSVFSNYDPPYSFPELLSGIDVKAYSKYELTDKEYSEIFVSRIQKFERIWIWERAGEHLPLPFAQVAYNIAESIKTAKLPKMMDVTLFVERFLFLFFFNSLSILQRCHYPITEYLKGFRNGEIRVGQILAIYNSLLQSVIDVLKDNVGNSHSKEYERFFSDPYLQIALPILQKLRNDALHGGREFSSEAEFMEHLPHLVLCAMSAGFWRVHPLLINGRIDSHELEQIVLATSLSGRAGLGSLQMMPHDTDIFMKETHVYHVLDNPEQRSQYDINYREVGFLCSLFPLVRMVTQNDRMELYIAQDFRKNTYRGMVSRKTYQFEDEELLTWWKAHTKGLNQNGKAKPVSLGKTNKQEAIHEIIDCLFRVEPSKKTDTSIEADVIFVHGLDGDGKTTWHPKDKPELFWPQWIAEELPYVSVSTLEYEASSIALGRRGASLTHLALFELDILEAAGIGTRPFVFVCHSLGGLLVKQMLRHASEMGKSAWEPFAKNLKGIEFLATPHSGSNIASWLTYLKHVLFLTITVEELQAHDSRLMELNTWYRNNVDALEILTDACFEGEKTKFAKLSIHVVPEGTADPGIKGVIAIPFPGKDHVSICKPTSRSDPLYVHCKRFISSCLRPNS